MLAILTTINNLLDIKMVQWMLMFYILVITVTFGVYCIRYNALRLEHSFLQVELAKTASALTVQNKAIQDAGELARKIQDRYDKKVSEASKIALQSTKALLGISEYQFEGECSQNVSQALVIVKKGIPTK